MARPLRYEAAGAVYHVMARGDGGKNVFDDDKDRFAWTDLMEKAHARGGKAYAGYLEARANDRKGVMTDAALSALRKGWYLGEKSFGEKILESIKMPFAADKKKGSVGGVAARAHDEAAAERLVSKALSFLGLPGDRAELLGRGKWKDETELVEALVRKWTGMTNRWLAYRLGMATK